MFIAIAIHHAAPEYADEFLAFMRQVVTATAGTPGLVEFVCGRDPRSGNLAGISRWESADAFRAALPTIGSLGHLRKAEWSTAPDELITFEQV